jgi:hypothetical protein
MPFGHLFAIWKTWFSLQGLQVIIITHRWLSWLQEYRIVHKQQTWSVHLFSE